ncbi:hypothetical protein ACE1TI_18580 [Alteribacillus sp. JSM 102045]|uniref:hypothetical protein n=1 Tax=Alteribacillus sp. JSM 102045 TaxID=1562101 RepID=UPI0035C23015
MEVNDVQPDVESIQQDQYPLTNEFYALTNRSDHPHIDSFMEWILSEQGQSLIEKTGYVPIAE